MDLELTGLHHVTAITAQASANRQFYAQALGLRLVKKTVNQDDTSAYHLFYADGLASPGTDLTFFDFPAGRERRGTGSVVRTGLRVGSAASLDWWAERIASMGLVNDGIADRVGSPCLDFEDPEGQRLRLISDDGAGPSHPWNKSPVPVEHQIRGLGPVVLSVRRLGATERILTDVLNLRRVGTAQDGEHTVHMFATGTGGLGSQVHVIEQPDLPLAGQGAGAVHHIAFRTSNVAQLTAWTDRLTQFGLRHSGEVERHYFRSLYVREPNGILIEIATDGPGFTVDEPLDTLGETLSLPPFLEARRASIEANLKPLA